MTRSLTRAKLKELLFYRPEEGIFFWKEDRGPVRFADIAGKTTEHGYVSISVDGEAWYAHQLAWLYVYGPPLPSRIDHRNGNGQDNRIDNLRAATHAENLWNSGAKSHNKIGIKGVTRVGRRFRAELRVNKKRIHIGYFATPEDASAAYAMAAAEHHGDFANAVGRGCGE